MRTAFSAWRYLAGLCCLMLAANVAGAEAVPSVTNLLQIRQLNFQGPGATYFVEVALEGEVCWANPGQKQIALLDASGGILLEVKWLSQPLHAGQRVRLTGTGTLYKRGDTFLLKDERLVVDNDGLHTMVEKSGVTFLKAGRSPIRIDWFNQTGDYGLKLEYEGPGLPRRNVGNAELSRIKGGDTNQMKGLDYRDYEGSWTVLPDFNELKTVRTGICSDFDLSVRSRNETVGLQFYGFLEVPRDGLYNFFLSSDDGSRLFVGGAGLQLEIIGESGLPTPRQIALSQVLGEKEDGLWAQVEGKVTHVKVEPDGLRLELSVGLARMEVEVTDTTDETPAVLLDNVVRAVGFCQCAYNTDGLKIPHRLLVSSLQRIEMVQLSSTPGATNESPGALPTLTTAVEVHRLKRNEALRGYPVKVSGVITCLTPESRGFVLQDSTRGVFVSNPGNTWSYALQIGDYVQVEGTTDPSEFSPVVKAQTLKILSMGRLPDPIRPTWDQLIGGSLDAQFVEVQGIVTTASTNGLSLVTADGFIKINLRLNDPNGVPLNSYENALVMIRGCLLADWDYMTHQLRLGDVWISGADITVVQPPPADLFSSPRKSARELLLFDPQAGAFQRIKLSGQVVHVAGTECFLTAESNGVRCVAKKPAGVARGDLVEAVGFPELGGASPILREAVVRRTGHAVLPEAKPLETGNLLSAEYDALRVRVAGALVEVRGTPLNGVLEVQAGERSFVARLNNESDFLHSLPVGSRMELTGVYAAIGGNRALNQDITSFELLLDTSEDIKILTRPPWWTLERVLVIMGLLAAALVAASGWVYMLRRRVRSVAAQLQEEAQASATLTERTRLASEIHDSVQQSISGIMLQLDAARATLDESPETMRRYLESAQSMAQFSLTEIEHALWNWQSPALENADLGVALTHIAEQVSSASRTQVNVEIVGPLRKLGPTVEHHLLRIGQESITNALKHAQAQSVHVVLSCSESAVSISIRDDGCGFVPEKALNAQHGHFGLESLRGRARKMGAKLRVLSEPGKGTTIEVIVPLRSDGS